MAPSTPTAASPARRGESRGLRRLWTDHEEGVLYAIAVVVYIPAGVFLKTVVLNWFVGITFPLLVVYVIPAAIRRRRGSVPPEVGGHVR